MADEDKLREYLRRVTVDLANTRRRLAEADAREHEPIAVIGMSCRFPDAPDVAAYWDMLHAGRAAEITGFPSGRFDHDPDADVNTLYQPKTGAFLADVAGWDAEFFGSPPREALRTDPQQRLLMELAWEAMEDAGTPPATLAGSRTGVLLGFSDAFQYGQLERDREGIDVYTDPYMGQGSLGSVVAGRIAYHFDLRGPAFCLDTACSSSLVAVHLAVKALRDNECDYALVGGGYLALHEFLYIYSCSNALLADRCNTFDAGANGYMMGEGGGMVLLTRLSDAEHHGHRVRAVIRGSAVNQDGRSNGLTAPNRDAQVDVIRRAHASARVGTDDVAFVEAHGSGTALGDEIELGALNDVFGQRTTELLVGAVKTNIGHTHTAAGIAGLIKTVLVLENGMVPPNLNMVDPADAVVASDIVRPASALTELPAGAIAGVSSFGWSGTNAHVVLEAPGPRTPATGAQGLELLPVSAADENALRDRLRALSTSDADLADLAHTLQLGRTQHEYRRAVVATDAADARAGLCRVQQAVRVCQDKPRVAFLLPGVGDQYRGLGQALYQREPVFAEAVDECLAIAADRCGTDLRTVFLALPPAAVQAPSLFGGGPADDVLDHARIAHPFLFTVEYALARLLESRGIVPDLLVGYSLGEYVAACIAGVFTLSDALWVVTERARLIESAPAGRMLAAAAGPEQLTDLPASVGIAALNGPQMTVLSGPPTEIDLVSQHLRANGIANRALRSAHPFHSVLLEPMHDKLAALIASVDRAAPRIPIISNTTGTELTEAQAIDPQYWAEHLHQPVRFAQSVRDLAVDAYVELGPGQTLGGLVRQNITARPAILGTLPAPWPAEDRPEENLGLLETCGRLWEIGVELDWSALRRGGGLVSLPPYPFQRTRYWPRATEHPTVSQDGLVYAPVWRADLSRPEPGELAGTLIVFADDTGVGGRLADIAEAAGMRVVEVVPGAGRRQDGRRVVIDPTVPRLYREILAANGPVQVVHLWSLLADTPEGAIAHGVDSLLLAVQALAGTAREHGVRLLTVSCGSAEIVGGDAPAPFRSIVHGLGRGVRAEYAGLSWRGIDLQPGADPLESARRLADELRCGPWSYDDAAAEPALVGWRNGRRWLKGYTEITPSGEPGWDGAYLITGGTRGLGLLLAKHLVSHGVRKLALVSRTGGPVEGLADAEVLVLKADVGDPDQFRAALRRAREHFGSIDGVVHAAGVPGSGLAQRQTLADVHSVLAPKILALEPIAELIASDSPPGRVILYSSVSTVLGGLGEGDYCAANTVLDAYGTALAATPATQVVTVTWGHWQYDAWHDGNAAAEDRAAYRRRNGFSDAAGLAMLDRIVGGVHGTVVAMRQQLPAAQREWAALSNLTDLVEAAAAADPTRFPRPHLRTDYAAPRTELEATVAEIWGEFLGIDRIGVHDPFFDLGGTSLVGMAMVTAIEKVVGRPIAPAVLFGYPTVAAFATELTSVDVPTPVAGSARGERRRRNRPALQARQK